MVDVLNSIENEFLFSITSIPLYPLLAGVGSIAVVFLYLRVMYHMCTFRTPGVFCTVCVFYIPVLGISKLFAIHINFLFVLVAAPTGTLFHR